MSNRKWISVPRCNEESMVSLEEYFRDISRYPLLTAQEERELTILAQGGDTEARNQMVEGNLRLVIKIAKSYRGRGIAIQDLIEAGNLGLFKAVDRFDVSLGFKFSTYATNWIKQSIRRLIENTASKVRTPSYMQDLKRRVDEVKSDFAAQGQHNISILDILRGLGYTGQRVHSLAHGLMRANSVSNVKSTDATAMDDPASQARDGPEAPSERNEELELLAKSMKLLTPRDRQIIELRFGIIDGIERTLKEVAEIIDPPLTRERVRQIICKAIVRIRSSIDGHKEA